MSRKAKIYIARIQAVREDGTDLVVQRRIIEATGIAKVVDLLIATGAIEIKEAGPAELVALGGAGVKIERAAPEDLAL